MTTINILAAMVMAMASPPAEPYQPHETPTPSKRDSVISVAQSTVGWKEATGNNDGRNIDAILASVGLEGTRSPYCAAWVVYCYEQAGAGDKIPHTAWSPSIVENPTWKRGRGETPRPADVFGIWFPSKGRVAHCGIVEKWSNGTAVTIEGNTGPQTEPGSERDRDATDQGGVWRRWRLTSTIYSVKSYL